MEQASQLQGPVVIKKYSNRRLYDTATSRYITLAELEAMIRRGTEVRVVDSKSGADLTQATLVQIILDGRGATTLLPVGLLVQLIRMGDDALAEFLGRYMSYALELYVQAKQGAQAFMPYNPMYGMPFEGAGGLGRVWGRAGDWLRGSGVAEARGAASGDEVATLRRELEEIKSSLRGPAKRGKRQAGSGKR